MTGAELNPQPLHPSFLALDRVHLGAATAEVSAHLAGCDECRNYVASLGTVPPALDMGALRKAAGRRTTSLMPWLAAGTTVVAAAAGLWLFAQSSETLPPEAPPAYVGAKGFESASLYVKRGDETRLWDGGQPIASGDRLQLKVHAGEYRHLQVYSLGDPQQPVLLFAAPLTPQQGLTLPDAWEVDASPEPERLFIVFSQTPVEPQWQDLLSSKVPAGVSILSFTLAKTGSPLPSGSSSP